MSRLVFLESRAQVHWSRRALQPGPRTRRVAVTAEALEALEECGLPHEAVAAYADLRPLAQADDQFNIDTFALAKEIESYIGERYAPARFEGPGFLSGQAYYLQYAVSAVAKRALLIRDAIRACSPDIVTTFEGEVDPWFLGDGYSRNPWIEVLESLAKEYRCSLEAVPATCIRPGYLRSVSWKARQLSNQLRVFLRRCHRYARRRRRTFFPGMPSPGISLNDHAGLRLLMMDESLFDWRPVVDALRRDQGVECFMIESAYLDQRVWTHRYETTLRCLLREGEYDLRVGAPRTDEPERQTLLRLFDDWLQQRAKPAELDVLGMNVFPALATHLRAMTCLGPALVRHADAVADRALEIAKPHTVCFAAIASLAAKRFAYRCYQNDVPVVCYQHGFGYGVQIQAKDEGTDPAFADYFLTYGAGIRPRTNAAFPVRARYVSVGSARIERMRDRWLDRQSVQRNVMNVLWVAESSTRNTHVTSLTEDTTRYLLQKRCLEILGCSERLRVTYRPYKYSMAWEGTTRWLGRARLLSVRIDVIAPLEELIAANDVVIVATSSPSTWAEVIALRKPMILFCDPEQTLLTPEFSKELERVCHWCRSGDELVAAVHRLAAEGWAFLDELKKTDAEKFIRDYILDRDGGQCVQRVVGFLNAVCREAQRVEEWCTSARKVDR